MGDLRDAEIDESPIPQPPCVPAGVSCWTGEAVGALDPEDRAALEAALERLGVASAVAQRLREPITTLAKLGIGRQEGDRLYLLGDEGELAGLLRVGPRHLYYYDRAGAVQVRLRPRRCAVPRECRTVRFAGPARGRTSAGR